MKQGQPSGHQIEDHLRGSWLEGKALVEKEPVALQQVVQRTKIQDWSKNEAIILCEYNWFNINTYIKNPSDEGLFSKEAPLSTIVQLKMLLQLPLLVHSRFSEHNSC